MSINELNNAILELYSRPRERKIGRYSATDIYNIRKGYLKPENYFQPEKPTMQSVKNFFRGYAYENQLLKNFNELGIEQERNGNDQIKIEYKVDEEITLVMKPDFVLNGAILETKSPNKLFDKIPEWYKDQLEIQHRLLNKKVVLTIINTGKNEYPLLLGIEYKPSLKRWENIIKLLKDFHNKLCNLKK